MSGGAGRRRGRRPDAARAGRPSSPRRRSSAVVNTGDDTVLHGLTISPDLDTITYTLAGAIDPERGWGLAGETWHAMEALDALRCRAARRLGRRRHVVPPRRPGPGHPPVPDAPAGRRGVAHRRDRRDPPRLGLGVALLPMTDGAGADRGDDASARAGSAFQDVLRAAGATPCRSAGCASARTRRRHRHPAALAALDAADTIVIAPSNPIVSIGPLRALPASTPLLGRRRDRRGRVADHRRRGAERSGRPDAGRARPRGVGRRRGPAVRADRRRTGHRPRRRRPRRGVEAAGMRAVVSRR